MTPYIGAGVGGAYMRVSDFASAAAPPFTGGDRSQWQLAWAAMAGLGYAVSPRLTVDIGYRYLGFGNVKTDADALGAMTVKDIARTKCAPDCVGISMIGPRSNNMNINGNNHQRGHLYAVVFSLCALFTAGSGTAIAADWPEDVPLRGTISAGPMRWDGMNAGVQGGLSVMNTAFSASNGSQIAYILRNTTIENEFSPSGWVTLPSTDTNSASYGAFLGYSVQYDALVLGVDSPTIACRHGSGCHGQSSRGNSPRRTDFIINVMIDGTVSVKLVDYATLRGRAGYAIGQFLPYAFAWPRGRPI